MKRIFFLISILSISLLSCEKEIDIDLNEADQKIVIEGIVSNQEGRSFVRLTKSIPFDESNVYPSVSGASVVIEENINGVLTSFNLLEQSSGVYSNPDLTGQSGATYRLKVIAEGETYEASSTMPTEVAIADYFVEEFFADQFFPNVVFLDPADESNNYRFKLWINGEAVESIFLQDDTFSDGTINTSILGDGENDVSVGDTIDIELRAIDRATYDYFFALSQNVSEQTAAPANPITNVSNGALGYFSAEASNSVNFIVE
ncbi:MAG: DUF4249 domain-containing protein [Flavobacteriales bacterium]|jgi:hypothetical protein